MSAAPPALGVRGLRVRRGGREVLHVERLEVAAGETLAVLGPNGAGKSTLLQSAGLLLPAAEGSVAVFGEPPRGSRHRVRLRRMTSTVFQEPALLDMSAIANVETALALHGVGRHERRQRAGEWLERLGVAHLAGARSHTLSGGEAQRVSLARAFSVRPRLLMLDEPFVSLDPETRSRLVSDVRTLLHEDGAAALLATHDQTEAVLLADRAIVLLAGEVVQSGPIAEVLHAPATPEVAAFLGYSVLDAALVWRLLDGGRKEGERTGRAAVRPEAVELLDATGAPAAAPRAPVIAVGGAHGRARVVVDVGGAPLAASIEVERVAQMALRTGTVVAVRIDAGGVIWF